MTAARIDIAAGDTFGPYRVVGKIAGGGYRAVCFTRARSSLYRLDVADADDWRDASVRMMRAARVVDALHHPGIARVADHGIERARGDNRAWQATEVPPGVALYDVIARRTMQAFEVAALLRDVADALAYAHARGVVHGGLAMRAIVIPTGAREHPVCVAEWGHPPRDLGVYGARELEDGAGSASADIYALGVIAYRAATGRFPIAAVADLPHAPAALATLIRRMLAESPDARPTAAEVRALAAEVAELVGHEPEHLAAPDDDEAIEIESFVIEEDDSVIEVIVKPRFASPRWTPATPMKVITPEAENCAVWGEIGEKS